MKTKTYIAVLLVSIFLVKSVAIDAKGLNMMFSEGDITFVNPYCKKESPLTESKDTSVFSKIDSSSLEIFALSGHCSTQFQFELFSWETNFSESVAVYHESFASKLQYRYLDNLSPPPRLT